MIKSVQDFKKLMQIKGYSPNTINAYLNALRLFQSAGKFRDWGKLDDQYIQDLTFRLFTNKKMSYAYQKQFIGAVQLFYKLMYDRMIGLSILSFARKSFKLPTVLSKSEVAKILRTTENLKHKAMLVTIYSLGLRVGELINLKISDLDSSRQVITIHNAKGKKDRQLMFPESLKALLREYYIAYKPKHYLFNGQKAPQYTAGSALKVLKKSARRAGISKRVTLHTLRHSFATHLLEEGTYVRIIQKLLGHSSIKTTMIYTHVANDHLIRVKSPIDSLDI